MKKTYTWTSPPHYSLQFDLNFLKIDTWDAGDEVQIYLDNLLVRSIKSTREDGPGNECGDGLWNERMFPVSYTFGLHQKSDLLVHIKSILDEAITNEAWGVRDIKIYVNTCESTCASCNGPLKNNCKSCFPNAKLENNECKCREYYYHKDLGTSPCAKSPCGSCERCHIRCLLCKGPESTDCLSCHPEDTLENNNCIPPSSKFSLIYKHQSYYLFIHFRCTYNRTGLHQKWFLWR